MTDDLIQRLEQGVADTGTAINTAASINATMAEAKHRIERLTEERDTFYADYRIKCDRETKRLEEELAALKAQKPIAWGVFYKDGLAHIFQQRETAECFGNSIPLYTAPQLS